MIFQAFLRHRASNIALVSLISFSLVWGGFLSPAKAESDKNGHPPFHFASAIETIERLKKEEEQLYLLYMKWHLATVTLAAFDSHRPRRAGTPRPFDPTSLYPLHFKRLPQQRASANQSSVPFDEEYWRVMSGDSRRRGDYEWGRGNLEALLKKDFESSPTCRGCHGDPSEILEEIDPADLMSHIESLDYFQEEDEEISAVSSAVSLVDEPLLPGLVVKIEAYFNGESVFPSGERPLPREKGERTRRSILAPVDLVEIYKRIFFEAKAAIEWLLVDGTSQFESLSMDERVAINQSGVQYFNDLARLILMGEIDREHEAARYSLIKVRQREKGMEDSPLFLPLSARLPTAEEIAELSFLKVPKDSPFLGDIIENPYFRLEIPKEKRFFLSLRALGELREVAVILSPHNRERWAAVLQSKILEILTDGALKLGVVPAGAGKEFRELRDFLPAGMPTHLVERLSEMVERELSLREKEMHQSLLPELLTTGTQAYEDAHYINLARNEKIKYFPFPNLEQLEAILSKINQEEGKIPLFDEKLLSRILDEALKPTAVTEEGEGEEPFWKRQKLQMMEAWGDYAKKNEGLLRVLSEVLSSPKELAKSLSSLMEEVNAAVVAKAMIRSSGHPVFFSERLRQRIIEEGTAQNKIPQQMSFLNSPEHVRLNEQFVTYKNMMDLAQETPSILSGPGTRTMGGLSQALQQLALAAKFGNSARGGALSTYLEIYSKRYPLLDSIFEQHRIVFQEELIAWADRLASDFFSKGAKSLSAADKLQRELEFEALYSSSIGELEALQREASSGTNFQDYLELRRELGELFVSDSLGDGRIKNRGYIGLFGVLPDTLEDNPIHFSLALEALAPSMKTFLEEKVEESSLFERAGENLKIRYVQLVCELVAKTLAGQTTQSAGRALRNKIREIRENREGVDLLPEAMRRPDLSAMDYFHRREDSGWE